MLHINIICVGKLKEKYLQDALSEYSKRLSKYCNLNIIELPDEKLPNNLNDSLINQIKQKESNNKKSKIRARVEHISGFMTNSMNNALYMRSIGIKRIKESIGLLNLTYNLFRFEQLIRLEKVKI